MKAFLSVLCVALVIQLGSAFTEEVPERFKAVQGLEFHQDAADKAANRSITSVDIDPSQIFADKVQTPIDAAVAEPEEAAADVAAEKTADENTATEENFETPDGEAAAVEEEQNSENDNALEVEPEAEPETAKLEARDIDAVENENDLEEDENLADDASDDQDLVKRGLLESGMNMVPTNLRETAANLGQHASNLGQHVASAKDAAVKMIQNPQAAKETIEKAFANAKERVLSPELRQKFSNMYQSGIDHGLNMYKQLNQRLSPSMSKALNQGVSTAIRGVAAAKESPIAKKISERLSSFSN